MPSHAAHAAHADLNVDVKQAPVSNLVALHGAIVTELMARHVGHKRTSPAGDLASLLVAEAYEGVLVRGNQTWSVEAAGRRLLVRSRMQLPTDKPSTTYSPVTDWDFDDGVFLVIDGLTCEVLKGVEVPATQLRTLARSSSGKVAARIRVDKDLMTLDGARNVAPEVEKAMSRIDAERFARRHSDDASGTEADQRPTGWCLCGCGQPTDPGARFLVMHERRADSPALRECYGTVSGLVVT